MLLVAYTDMVVVVVPELTAWGQQVLYTHYPGSLGGQDHPSPHPTYPIFQLLGVWAGGGGTPPSVSQLLRTAFQQGWVSSNYSIL